MSATIPVVPSAPAEPTAAPGAFPGQPPVAAATPTNWLSISSLVLGLASIVAGWTFVMPVAGLVTGILALKREPAARTMAVWGVVLNAVLLAGGILVGIAALLFGLAALPFALLPLNLY